jgi:hypothetical protein
LAGVGANSQGSQHRLAFGQLAPRPLDPPLVLLHLLGSTTTGGCGDGGGGSMVLEEEHVVEPPLGAAALGQLPCAVPHPPLPLWVL